MKRKIILLLIIAFWGFFSAKNVQASSTSGLGGKILLQVEENGEAWYVYPRNNRRYFLARPTDAFDIMRRLGLGAKHSLIADTEIFPQNLLGMILLDVERKGEAYYINPVDRKKYYLGKPADAFSIMRNFGLGITNNDLSKIEEAEVNQKIEKKQTTDTVSLNISFTSQAPFGNWADQRQEDGCEESSSLMAVYWARGLNLSKEKALDEIIKISDWELKKYGEFRDSGALDTLERIIKDYFGFNKAYLRERVSKQDLIDELERGNALIMPVNGRVLKNPYYTQPGPLRHMLVVRGYDSTRDIFITNDPGTRHGEGYEYGTDRLFYSMRDYKTGFHEDIVGVNRVMIVVSKE